MLHRDHGKFSFECDSCDEVLETDTGEFQEAKRRLDSERWSARQIGVDWVHGCPKHPVWRR